MKKSLLTLFFLISLTEIGSAQKLKASINGVWLAVESRQYKDKGIYPMDGIIYDVQDGIITVSATSIDSTWIETYKFKGDRKILVNKKLERNILHISTDSLLLLFDNRMIVKFIPVHPIKDSTSRSDIKLENASWQYELDGSNLRIDFLPLLSQEYPGDISKLCVSHVEDKRFSKKFIESYSWRNYKGVIFFTLSTGADLYIHKVTSIQDSLIEMELLTASSKIRCQLYKNNSISNEQKSKVAAMLNRTWYTDAIVDYADRFERDEYLDAGGWEVKDTLIRRRDFLNKSITLNFTEPEYLLMSHTQVISSGKWQVSDDGKYIILNKGTKGSDYIKIISLNADELIIGKSDKLQLDDSDSKLGYDYKEYYYILRMKYKS